MERPYTTAKIILTPQQQAWFVAHYKHTKNEVICAKLGITLSTMQRIKRDLGLTKSQQFMHKMQTNATAAAQIAVANETDEQKERRRQQARTNGAKSRFAPHEYALRDKSPEELSDIHRRKSETWRKTRREDEIRLNWGYQQQTKFHFARLKDTDLNRQLCGLRYYLRKLCYDIPQKSGMVAYITAYTKRSAKCEAKAKQFGMIFRTNPVNP